MSGRVIFVVGARRSGTNWLQRILSAHPDCVAVPSETYLLSHGARPLLDRVHHGALSSSATGSVYANREAILDALRDLCDTVFTGLIQGLSDSASRVIERTPEHVLHLDLIADIYPDAHVVHIIRDGRDVVRSLLSHDWGPSDARDAAVEWRDAIQAAHSARSRLRHYHEVRYEQLLADLPTEVVRLFDAVALPTDEHAVAPVLAEAGVDFNTDPTSPTIEVAKWRSALQPDVLAAIDDVAAELLESLGYPRSPVQARTLPARASTRRSLPRRLRDIRRPRRATERLIDRLEIGQQILDRFLEAAVTDPERVLDLMNPRAQVRIVDGDMRFEQRGEAAHRELVRSLSSDRALAGVQRVGYVHPAAPSVTFVGAFELEGRRHARVFVLTVTAGLIDRVAYYRLTPS